MAEPESDESFTNNETETQSTTAWHPMLVALLEYYLPQGWQLLPEFLLSRLPQRVDIVVLRLVHTPAGVASKIHSIFDYLRPHTLIEHKGPTDDLEAWDALTLLGYAMQYMRLSKVSDPGDLCLMVVCDRITAGFVKQVERHRGTFAPVGGGLWRGEVAGLLLHGVETRDVCTSSPTEHLLYTFSRAYVRHPLGIGPLDMEEARVYTTFYEHVEQFRRKRGDMALRDLDAAQKSYDEVWAELAARVPLDVLLRKVPKAEVAKSLTPEQRLEGLTPEERLEGLTPEDLRRLFTSDEVLKALPPEVLAEMAEKQAR